MASYFDLPAQQKAGPVNIEAVPKEQRKELGAMSLLSPAVTQLLDDLGQEHSDSDSEEGTLSQPEEEQTEHQKGSALKNSQVLHEDKDTKSQKSTEGSPLPKKGTHSPGKSSAHSRLSPSQSGGGSSAKPKQPHMARFHSLRSMLFSSNIEDKVRKLNEGDGEKEETAANNWKSQHDQRQINRPKTPEKDGQGKEHGIGSRLKTRIRRMTSKEVPTMVSLKEDGGPHDFSDHGSTASSENEAEPYRWKPREADEESIDHSDVEDLVRWVSRRDPPSDGEARAAGKVPVITETREDSEHDSLGHSDVDDLVRWVSRKSSRPESKQEYHTGYSDASTESDSEIAREPDSSEDEDAEDLMRWISHRDGPTAGPVRRKPQDISNSSETASHISYDSDIPELGRWIKRHDDTSGESRATTPLHEERDMEEEPERGRPRSRDRPVREKQKTHLTHDDVDELVRWVSRHSSKQESPPQQDKEAERLRLQEDVKKQKVGMTVDEGSLSHSDVKDLIEHVQSNYNPAENSKQENKQRNLVEQDQEAALIQSQQDDKKQQLGMTVDEGSLSHSDVKGLIDHVRLNHAASKGSPQSEKKPHPLQQDQDSSTILADQDAKKQALGMAIDEGSLSHSDIQDVITHVKTSDISSTPAASSSSRTAPETGDLRKLRTNEREAKQFADLEHTKISRGESTDIDTTDFAPPEKRGSLAEEDVDELVKWVSRKG